MMARRLSAELYQCSCRVLTHNFSRDAASLLLENNISGRLLLGAPQCRTISPTVCTNKHTWTGDHRPRNKFGLSMRSLLHDDDKHKIVERNNEYLRNYDKMETVHTDKRVGMLDDIVGQLLKDKQEVSNDTWTSIRDKLDGHQQFKKAWPVRIMLMLANKEPPSKYVFSLGQSLQQYYCSNMSEKMKIAMLVPFILLCASHGGVEKRDTFDATYEELCNITDVLDAMSALTLIRAFSLTSRWRECFTFLDMVKLTSELTSASYSPIIVAALKADDTSTVKELIGTMVNNDLIPTDDVFKTMIGLDDGSGQRVTDMLLKMSSYSWIPSASVVEQLKDWFESRTTDTWRGTYVDITSKGVCESCCMPLESLSTITPEDFTELRESFLAKSVKRGNVFLNSSPEELKRFADFLRENAPFDIVVDALNISHVTSQKASLQHRAKLVERVVEHFANAYKMKVLVMGRKHMRSWPHPVLGSIEKLASCFYAENISADDPFMLYASLYSGQRTIIVTRDELRDHRFLLGPELATKFKKWQRGHQMAFDGVFRKKSGHEVLKFTWPDVHETVVQQSPNGWHIPFCDGGKKTSFQLATKWLCLTRQLTK